MNAQETAAQVIRVGHSPDPDDAFMFYALAKNKVNTHGFKFVDVVEDIESLNRRALRGELEVTAISLHAYAYVHEQYAIMTPGASFGFRYGPRIVTRGGIKNTELKGKTIAVPGEMTSAFLLLKTYEPDFKHVVVPFDQILDYVKEGKADAGLVIHEGQLTYQEFGLENILDLGEWWYQETKLPVPLGIDCVSKKLPLETQRLIAGILRDSIQHALEHRKEAVAYALPFGRGIGEQLADEFVGMYVNERTLDMDRDSREAVTRLLQIGYEKKIIQKLVKPEFIEPMQ